jgi:ABC-type Fe3+ transport system substrate-binding protein
MNYVSLNDTLYEVVQQYPESKDFFMSQGLEQVEDRQQLEKLGKILTIQQVIMTKKLSEKLFLSELNQYIDSTKHQVDTTLYERQENQKAIIQVKGVLPCPVRLPLLEGFESWMADQPEAYKGSIDYELKAASMGVDWLKDALVHGDDSCVADVFLSAGFDLFFDDRYIGHMKKEKVFKDLSTFGHFNQDFDNEQLSLIDPDGDYSMVGVVPAVFLVNKDVLGERQMPNSWEDLLDESFEGSVSLPVGDFDLFNGILLNIHKQYGMEGIRKLGKSLLESMHPSEMVKSNRRQEQPAVTIMPYFFTKMVHKNGPLVPVWPIDGAIISPIFLLSKQEKAEELQPIVEFFTSKAVGEILSHNGRFPSVHPEVDNFIPKENKYMWLGWDYIKSHNIGELIESCTNVFNGLE